MRNNSSFNFYFTFVKFLFVIVIFTSATTIYIIDKKQDELFSTLFSQYIEPSGMLNELQNIYDVNVLETLELMNDKLITKNEAIDILVSSKTLIISSWNKYYSQKKLKEGQYSQKEIDIFNEFKINIDTINEAITNLVKTEQQGTKTYLHNSVSQLLISDINKVKYLLDDIIIENISQVSKSRISMKKQANQFILYASLSILFISLVLLIALDIIGRKMKMLNVKLENAAQAKDDFLSNMSHEIRTPLNAILGFVNILKKEVQGNSAQKYLNIISESGKSLETIINDILDFSKIQSTKFTISPYEMDFTQEINNTEQLFASKAYEKGIVYSTYIDPKIPSIISIDGIRVKQILTNLLSNAIKFTPEFGTVEVDVTIEDSIISIAVKDTGIGIEENNLAKIFSAFEQADTSTTRKFGGTGLGLSISHKLAQLLGGDLAVTSTYGKETTFTLTVPVDIIKQEVKQFIDPKELSGLTIAILDNWTYENRRNLIKRYLLDLGAVNIIELDKFQEDGYDLLFFTPEDDFNEEIIALKKPSIAILKDVSVKLASFKYIEPLYMPYEASSIVAAINACGVVKTIASDTTAVIVENEEIKFKGSILVAEDNKTNQLLISLLLQDYGLKYKIANNGVEAVLMFKEEKFDLVLMDENMPELNGIGAMEQIKEYEARENITPTPIVALTASALDADKKRFADVGMDGFVAKPINESELESELGRFLENV